VRKFGLTMEWEELPWEFRAPRFFAAERRFRTGPLDRLRASLRLDDAPAGTAIRYDLALTPRNAIVRPVVALDANLTVKPQLEKALRQAVALLDGQPVRYDPPPPPLPAAVVRRVDEIAGGLGPVGAGLRELLLRGPLRDQDRIRPFAFAQRWGVSGEEAVLGCLAAVKHGLLALRWDLLCPSCRESRAELDALVAEPGTLHCEACNLSFDASFPESIEAVFRPAQSIRRIEFAPQCLASPARARHVVAQLPLGPREEGSLTADLTIGSWKLHTRGIAGSAIVEVDPAAPGRTAAVDLERDGPWPGALRVQPGTVTLHLRSRLDRPIAAVIEDRWVPEDALTAGRLLEWSAARALLPPDALGRGAGGEVARTVLLVVDGQARGLGAGQRAKVSAWKPRSLDEVSGALFGRFDTVAPALAAAVEAVEDTWTSAAIHVGPVVDRGSGTAPSGLVVQEALGAIRRAGLGRVVAPSATVAEPEFRAAIAADGRLEVRSAPHGMSVLAAKRTGAPVRRGGTPGRFAGIYALDQRIAAGGHGEVWDGRDASGGRVAIKLLLPDLADDPEAVQRFWAEARLLSRLKSGAIVRTWDYGQAEDGRLFLVMERLIGRPLDEERGAGTLPPERVRALAGSLLEALGEAHAAGVLHRDIKPSNIFVVEDGSVRLLDFGIAHRIGDVNPFEHGQILGTPRYLAPEQLQARTLDGRTDLYALGIVLYELLTGQLPWDAGGQVFKRLAAPVNPLPDQVPADLRAAVHRALEIEPEERWPTAEAFRVALGSGR
jgi:hypothetical protein